MPGLRSFSALQRAENSSIHRRYPAPPAVRNVSVLFSEPKIPQFCAKVWLACAISCFSALQRAENSSMSHIRPECGMGVRVSVLFSEPKIPQLTNDGCQYTRTFEFQCSSASRKFLNPLNNLSKFAVDGQFQCSSASRKFLNQPAGWNGVDTI